ncbi:hypothetical protein [Hymenobacter sp. BT190]|uniref:hypothetical protein n=1 Tax=Hymenobacter sp. BT190 TaxID=2763505 RepID=UPI00165151BB|nr:hypothetical protein [Hymenobacter sp. BT190]MBC6699906.1 hypothetical protein [Hymenobacter sp. BT190]
MSKIVLLLLCALLVLLEPETMLAAAGPEAPLTESAVADAATETAIPRPNYKRYRGNSRTRKRRLGFFRRRAARRKAMRKNKQKATAPKGRIQVDAPIGTMPPRK